MIKNTTDFSNAQPVNQGEIRFLDKQVFKVGNDLSHKFRETIKLQDGSPLKLSPNDDVLQFRVIKGTQNGQVTENLALPAPLFTQARKGDKIFFSQNNENFALKLSPSQSWRGSKIETYPFDECLKGIVGQGCTAISMYLDEADIPEDKFVKTSEETQGSMQVGWNGGLFVKEEKGHLRWGDVIELSPNAQRLEMGKRGCLSTDFNDLMLSIWPVGENAAKCNVTHNKEKDRLILFVDQPGLNLISENSLINVDLIVDSNRLYVHSYQKSKEEMSPEDKARFQLEGDDYTKIVSEKFYWLNLEAGSLQIDKDAILATIEAGGVLKIELPYLKKQERPTKDSLLITEDELEGIDQQTQKIQENSNKIAETNPDIGTQSSAVTDLNESDEDYYIEEISNNEEENNQGYCIVS